MWKETENAEDINLLLTGFYFYMEISDILVQWAVSIFQQLSEFQMQVFR